MGKRLWVERNKDGSWDAFGEDGAHIKFGKGRGQFTPGDLMKIALAGCAALSSQFAIEHSWARARARKSLWTAPMTPTMTHTSVSTNRWSSTPPTPV